MINGSLPVTPPLTWATGSAKPRSSETHSLNTHAAQGALRAFEAIYRDHVGAVYGLCLRLTGSPDLAEDCTQEAVTHTADESSISLHAGSDTAPPLDLERAIAALPDGARHVLVLVGIYGYNHQEAAQLLGLTAGTCRAHLHRARQLLKKHLGLTETP